MIYHPSSGSVGLKFIHEFRRRRAIDPLLLHGKPNINFWTQPTDRCHTEIQTRSESERIWKKIRERERKKLFSEREEKRQQKNQRAHTADYNERNETTTSMWWRQKQAAHSRSEEMFSLDSTSVVFGAFGSSWAGKSVSSFSSQPSVIGKLRQIVVKIVS